MPCLSLRVERRETCICHYCRNISETASLAQADVPAKTPTCHNPWLKHPKTRPRRAVERVLLDVWSVRRQLATTFNPHAPVGVGHFDRQNCYLPWLRISCSSLVTNQDKKRLQKRGLSTFGGTFSLSTTILHIAYAQSERQDDGGNANIVKETIISKKQNIQDRNRDMQVNHTSEGCD